MFTILLPFTRPISGAGGPVTITNSHLVPGREYYNVFSMAPCPGGTGSGPSSGLCVVPEIAALYMALPVTSPSLDLPLRSRTPLHFIAPDSYVLWGPYPMAPNPALLEFVCIDVTGGTLNGESPVRSVIIN